MSERALFCRIGWMKEYKGPHKPFDPRPIGGGSWNRAHVGDEVYNFKPLGRYFYGFCQPSRSNNINLQRIEPGWSGERLPGVLVVFVAVDPDQGGQRVVGWYRKATVFRLRQRSVSGGRDKKGYFAVALVKNSTLLPIDPYRRTIPAERGKNGIGQANVCYLFRPNLQPKNLGWQRDILKKIKNYKT